MKTKFLCLLLILSAVFVVFAAFIPKINAETPILFQNSFENGFDGWSRYSPNSIITDESPQDGTYCMRALGGDGGNQSTNGYADVIFSEDYTTLYALTYVKMKEYPYAEDPNNFLYFLKNGVTYTATIGLYQNYTDGNFKWSLMYQNNTWGNRIDSNICVNPMLDVWYPVELMVTCGLGTAEYRVWLNGTELTDLHITEANSSSTGADYLEIADTHFRHDYDNVTISQQYIVPAITTSSSTNIISASAGANGEINPSGNVCVNVGSNQTFTITPDPYYHVADVLVDGISVGAVTSYTFSNVTAPHNITASFAINNSTYLLLNTDPQAVSLRGQEVTFEVTVLNQQNPPLQTTLTLTITGPDGYSHYDFQPISVGADDVFDYSFNWVVPNVQGKYIVSTSLAPATLTGYDTKWIDIS